MDSQHILFVGDQRHPEFREVCGSLAPSCQYREPAAARARVAEVGPAVVVLAQARRGEFSSHEVETLRLAYPEAVPLNVLGSWCEGETRSGRPYPGWHRVLWYRWPETWARLQAAAGLPSAAAGLAANSGSWRPAAVAAGGHCRAIGVLGRAASRLDALRQVLQAWGHTVELLESGDRAGLRLLSNVDCCLVAADSLDSWLRQAVGQVRRFRRLERVVVLLNFPRRAEVDWLQRQGGARMRVLGQPFELAELQWAVGGTAQHLARRTA